MEQSMLEVMEEEELENLRDQQRRFQVSSIFPTLFPSWDQFLNDILGNTKAGTMCNSKTGRARTETYTRKRTTNCSTARGMLYRKYTGNSCYRLYPELRLIFILRYEKKKKKRRKRLQREHTRKTILWVSKSNVGDCWPSAEPCPGAGNSLLF